MKSKSISIIPDNHIVRIALGTGLILMIPLLAMQFSDEVDWRLNDFVVIGVLLFGSGLLYELVSMRLRTRHGKIIAGLIVAAAVMYLWAELAVGIFTH